jgi:hypothetical protein
MERKINKCEALLSFWKQTLHQREKMAEWESLTLMWTNEYLLVTQVQEKHTSVTI